MDDFRVIYRILKALRDAMDDGAANPATLTPEALRVSENRLAALWAMLADNGYVVEGVAVRRYADRPAPAVHVTSPHITLRGLEYLQENSFMRRAAEVASGALDALT